MTQQYKVGTHRTTVRNTADEISVVYHSTEVVNYHKEIGELKLNTGGWFTPTTKTRMNQASNEFNLGFTVYQENSEWFVVVDYDYDDPVPFKGNALTLHL